MGQTSAIWVVIATALLAANAPFLNNRWFALGPLVRTAKPLALRLLEMVVWYFVVGALALWLEHRLGQIAPQGWEFYATTGSLFLTFAFPGFVYRYLMQRKPWSPSIEE